MLDDTASICVATGCAAAVHIKKYGLCGPHYQRAWKYGQLAGIGAGWHRVTGVSPDGYRGTCSVCGPGVAMANTGGRPVCNEARIRHSRDGRYNRKHLYGLTPDAILLLLTAADSACEVCATPLDEKSARIDHDHACCPGNRSCGGCVRGILCNRCNSGLGMLRDDPEVLASAIGYLRRSTKTSS